MIELKRMNVILGLQSSGKSTMLKVACFCDWMERQIVLTQDPNRYCKPDFFVHNLETFHKLEGFWQDDSYIRYAMMSSRLNTMQRRTRAITIGHRRPPSVGDTGV